MAGFTPDAQTAALWHLNDSGSPATWIDSVGAYPLTNHGVTSNPMGHFTGLAAGSFIRGSNRYFQSAASTNIDAFSTGDLTFIAWFMPTTWVSFETLLSINDSAHTNAFLVGLNSTGAIYGQQVNAAGTLVSYSLPSANALPLLQWVRVAVRRVSLGSGNYQWDFFYNGAKVGSWAPTGGLKATSSASLWIGGSGWGAPGDVLDGLLSDVLLEKRGLTDAEILADYNSYATGITPAAPQGHALDANTFCLWRLDEAYNGATWVDAVGRATIDQPTTGSANAAVPGLVSSGFARCFSQSSYGRRTTAAPAADCVTLSSGDVTTEFWVFLGSYPPGDTNVVVDLVDYAYAHGVLRTMISSDGSPGMFWESAGANNGVFKSGAVIPKKQWVHVAIRRYKEADSSWSCDFWINDQMMKKFTNVPVPDTLNVTDCYWALGIHPAAGSAGEWGSNDAFFDDIRVSNVKRSDAEIKQNYYNGIGYVTAGPSGRRRFNQGFN